MIQSIREWLAVRAARRAALRAEQARRQELRLAQITADLDEMFDEIAQPDREVSFAEMEDIYARLRAKYPLDFHATVVER